MFKTLIPLVRLSVCVCVTKFSANHLSLYIQKAEGPQKHLGLHTLAIIQAQHTLGAFGPQKHLKVFIHSPRPNIRAPLALGSTLDRRPRRHKSQSLQMASSSMQQLNSTPQLSHDVAYVLDVLVL